MGSAELCPSRNHVWPDPQPNLKKPVLLKMHIKNVVVFRWWSDTICNDIDSEGQFNSSSDTREGSIQFVFGPTPGTSPGPNQLHQLNS